MCIENSDLAIAKFESAIEEQVAAYNWIPPKWEEIRKQPALADTTTRPFGFGPYPGFDTVEKFVNECNDVKVELNPGRRPTGQLWPSPAADFTHIDPIPS